MILLHTESIPILAVMFASVLTIVGIFVLKFHVKVEDQSAKALAQRKKPRRR